MNKNYNSTLIRVAGNLLSGLASDWLPGGDGRKWAIREAVATAREIVAEVERTEPPQDQAVKS